MAYELHDSPGKTRSSRRSVDLDARTVEVLRALRDERGLEAGHPIAKKIASLLIRTGNRSIRTVSPRHQPPGGERRCAEPPAS